jgi:plastocyanin
MRRRRVRRISSLSIALLAGSAIALAIPGSAPGTPPPSTASFTAQDFSWHVTGDATSSTVTIAEGGMVSFGYPTGSYEHNADFSSNAVQPSCTQTAGTPGPGSPPPLPTVPTAAGWSGTCRFDTPGTYAFHCDMHPTLMHGTITVIDPNAPPPTTGGSTGTTGGSTGSTPPPSGTTGGTGATPGATTPAGGGSAPRVRLRVAHAQRSTLLHGAVTTPAARSRIDVVALVSNAALATHRLGGHARAVRVGERRLHSTTAGPTSFTVALDAAARGALRRRHRLTVTLRVVVTPPRGHAVVTTIRVVVRRA